MRTVEAPAKRADIVDRNGQLLAYSVEADTIYAVPTEIGDPLKASAALCGALDDCTAKDRAALADRIRKGKAFVYVRRQVSPEQARRVAELQLGGVGFLKENRRFYPNKSAGRARARARGHRQRRAGRHRGRLRLDHQGPARHRPHPRGRQAARLQPHRAEAHDRRHARADDRRAGAAHRRARAAGGRGVEWRGRCIRRGDGSVHGRAAGDGQLPDVQPERLPPVHRSRTPQPRHPGPVRAGLHLQDHHGQRRAGRAGGAPARPASTSARATSSSAAASSATTIATAC